MARLEPIDPDRMTPEQRQVHDNIIAGPRGAVRGPFSVIVRSPGPGDHVQALGAALRWGGTLPGRLREFAILITARFWKAQYEWCAHVPIAEKEGVDPAVIDAIRHKRKPEGLAKDEQAVFDFVSESLEYHAVTADTYAAALQAIGEEGLVELTILVGYYGIISLTLNAFQVSPKDSDVPPLED